MTAATFIHPASMALLWAGVSALGLGATVMLVLGARPEAESQLLAKQ